MTARDLAAALATLDDREIHLAIPLDVRLDDDEHPPDAARRTDYDVTRTRYDRQYGEVPIEGIPVAWWEWRTGPLRCSTPRRATGPAEQWSR